MALIIEFSHKYLGINQKRSWKNDTNDLSFIKIQNKIWGANKGVELWYLFNYVKFSPRINPKTKNNLSLESILRTQKVQKYSI